MTSPLDVLYPFAGPCLICGYSPGNYTLCRRCRNPFKWYVEGQHRYGGIGWPR